MKLLFWICHATSIYDIYHWKAEKEEVEWPDKCLKMAIWKTGASTAHIWADPEQTCPQTCREVAKNWKQPKKVSVLLGAPAPNFCSLRERLQIFAQRRPSVSFVLPAMLRQKSFLHHASTICIWYEPVTRSSFFLSFNKTHPIFQTSSSLPFFPTWITPFAMAPDHLHLSFSSRDE